VATSATGDAFDAFDGLDAFDAMVASLRGRAVLALTGAGCSTGSARELGACA
jgi:hypothetical protein